jgi:tetratricopeptide (TPR) repeat protein
LALALAAATLWVYAPVRGHEFVSYDDTIMVVENPHLRVPATPANLAAHFSTPFYRNWLPVYWISLHLGFALHGPDPGAFLLTNLAIHISATLLLFLALARMTRAPWPSAFVAGVFALHPLHVESVAWVSERKDVLGGLFWMLGLLLYARWVEAPSRTRYTALCVSLALGLMSKASLVTFPFALLLLDVWPLDRARGAWRKIFDEKVPLFALVIPAVALTYRFQAGEQPATAVESLGLGERLLNAVESCALYVQDALWPEALAALYPHPYAAVAPTAANVVAGIALFALLAGATAAAFALRRERPYAIVGWLWYLGTLVPTIGIVQVGLQGRADRYTYIPLVGLALIAGFGAADLARHASALRRIAITGAGVAALVACALVARGQVSHWRNSLALFEQAARVTKGNGFAHEAVAFEYASRGRNEDAASHFAEAVRIHPGRIRSHFGRAVTLVRLGRDDEAIDAYRTGLQLQPNKARAHAELGALLAEAKRCGEAIPHLERALQALPELQDLRDALATCEDALSADDASEPARTSRPPGP